MSSPREIWQAREIDGQQDLIREKDLSSLEALITARIWRKERRNRGSTEGRKAKKETEAPLTGLPFQLGNVATQCGRFLSTTRGAFIRVRIFMVSKHTFMKYVENVLHGGAQSLAFPDEIPLSSLARS